MSFCSCVFQSFKCCGCLACGVGEGVIIVPFVRLFDLGLSVFSSSGCLGRAAVCDCGTSWTFLLPFFLKFKSFVNTFEELSVSHMMSLFDKLILPILNYPFDGGSVFMRNCCPTLFERTSQR